MKPLVYLLSLFMEILHLNWFGPIQFAKWKLKSLCQVENSSIRSFKNNDIINPISLGDPYICLSITSQALEDGDNLKYPKTRMLYPSFKKYAKVFNCPVLIVSKCDRFWIAIVAKLVHTCFIKRREMALV